MSKAVLTLGAAILSGFSLSATALAQPAGSLLIWPVGPVIQGDEPAAALWLENPGKAPITLQVRVYAWDQRGGENVYAAQQDILGTPPILSIAPGERQLVRLTRLVPPPSQPEKPYRVVVDQIPTADAGQGAAAGAAVTFRMRYSLPLFSYAKAEGGRKQAPQPPPRLAWRAVSEGSGRFLEIRNTGSGHARLSDVVLSDSGKRLNEGLFGYVLPGATMRWPLPDGVDAQGELSATLNGKGSARIERLPE